MVGLTYLGPMIGAMCAFLWSGFAADKWLLYYARKKGGVREPEHRLWLLALNAIICPVGLILWGVGAGRGIHWFGLVFGGSMVAFTSATGGAFAINYALDSYKDLSGEVMITVILIRVSTVEGFHCIMLMTEYDELCSFLRNHTLDRNRLPECFHHRRPGGPCILRLVRCRCQIWQEMESSFKGRLLAIRQYQRDGPHLIDVIRRWMRQWEEDCAFRVVATGLV